MPRPDGEPRDTCPTVDEVLSHIGHNHEYGHGHTFDVPSVLDSALPSSVESQFASAWQEFGEEVRLSLERVRSANIELREWGNKMREERNYAINERDDKDSDLSEAGRKLEDAEDEIRRLTEERDDLARHIEKLERDVERLENEARLSA